MKINLDPVFRDDPFVVFKEGDKLTINGEDFDFTALPEGARLPAQAIDHPWYFSQYVERINGEIELFLTFPIPADATHNMKFPQPIIDPPDGQMWLPQPEVIEDGEH